ncbi:hypothetical protein MMU07_04055 [Aquiflexum sp. LQ15W]|uniref:hypothetical protein n=1 Tax=Cognataquiflexum nitidum TaxID=2922272 RepID=UPI001F14338D|nr:hypothetical protein [Cognataquiflexum nitidum]MCH6198742.1 hypothetical protein [Cognataquiflexum nitidum]
MGKIVLEVDKKTAEKWDGISLDQKKLLSKKIDQLLQASLEKGNNDFWVFVDEIRNEAKTNGLTEAELNEILNEG